MENKPYRWRYHIPLSSNEARRAFRKGVQVLCLHPNRKSKPATSEADIRKHAKRGGCFAVRKSELKQADATYTVFYYLRYPVSGPALKLETPEKDPSISRTYTNNWVMRENCQKDLTDLIKQRALPDGDYYAELIVDCNCMGDCSTTEVDEGVITVADGFVVKVPDSFILPF